MNTKHLTLPVLTDALIRLTLPNQIVCVIEPFDEMAETLSSVGRHMEDIVELFRFKQLEAFHKSEQASFGQESPVWANCFIGLPQDSLPQVYIIY